jgi:vacuolar-type H+-ATPase subunit I/STV1
MCRTPRRDRSVYCTPADEWSAHMTVVVPREVQGRSRQLIRTCRCPDAYGANLKIRREHAIILERIEDETGHLRKSCHEVLEAARSTIDDIEDDDFPEDLLDEIDRNHDRVTEALETMQKAIDEEKVLHSDLDKALARARKAKKVLEQAMSSVAWSKS